MSTTTNPHPPTHPRPLRGLLPYVVAEPGTFALVVLSGVLAAGAPIAAAGLGAALVGRVVTTGGAAALAEPLMLLAAVAFAAAVAAWWQSDVGHDWAFRLLRVLRLKLFDGLERAAPGRILGKRTGDLTTAAVADVNTTELFFAHTAGDYLGSVLVSVAAVVVIGSFDVPTALVASLVMALVAVVPFVLARRAGAQGRALRERLATLNAEVTDGIQGLRELVVFGQGPGYLDRLVQRTDQYHADQLRYGRRSGTEQAVTDALLGLGALAIFAVAARQVAAGALSAAAVPVVVVLAVAALAPIAAVSATARTLGDVRAAAGRVLQIIDFPQQVADRGTRPPAAGREVAIQFQNVHFGYRDGDPPVLRGVSFEVRPGETVALVGRSGVGKSTCANLLLRLWDAHAGAIRVGGVELRQYPLAVLRTLIAVVPQDVYLFHASVRDNIRLGRPDATHVEVEAAARLAAAHEFVTDLPDGYDTMCGERGAQLSGGQRQRIAIARALLTGAPVIVMDEPVASLDAESEQALQQAMATVRADRTTLVIAHRVSTIRSADRVVLLDDGRVLDQGPHEELLARSTPYRELLAAQTAVA